LEVKIRKAVFSDAAAIARVHVDSWKSTYSGIIPDSYLASLSYDRREKWWREVIGDDRSFVFVAEVDVPKQIVGFANGGQERLKDPDYSGELWAIYLLEDYRGKGIGQRLVLTLVKELVEQGHDSMLVWVLANNPYRRFYEKLGGKYLCSKRIEIGGSSYEEIAYGWRDLGEMLTLMI
jgi:ribosomal protein S18 acetylase RimI-like enzyme